MTELIVTEQNNKYVTQFTTIGQDIVLINKDKKAYIDIFANIDSENDSLIYSVLEQSNSSMFLMCVPSGINITITCSEPCHVYTNA